MQRLGIAGDDLDQEIIVDRQQEAVRARPHFHRRIDAPRQPKQRRRLERNAGPMVQELFATLRRVREAGVGLLLVEQNAQESLRIADRGYVLENGVIVGHGTADQLKADPAVQRAYLGGGPPATRHTDRQTLNGGQVMLQQRIL